MSGLHSDPLENALTAYFACRGSAFAAMPEVFDHLKDCPHLRKCAYRLQSALESCSMMHHQEESDLARILRALAKEITAGTFRQYVDNEFGESDGGFETVLSNEARRLCKLSGSLEELQTAWQHVQQAIAVDRELRRLRG